MCIRDRRIVGDEAVEQGDAEELGEGVHHSRHDAVAHEASAVSYTHLRAHETVLDLVCRLLLEKKKTRVEHHIAQNLLSTTTYSQLHIVLATSLSPHTYHTT